MPTKSSFPRKATAGLVARAQAGDREAYDRLFALASDRLQLFIRVRLGAALRGHEDSLDLVQETYLQAHRVFAQFEYRGDDAVARWLCRIAERCICERADHHGAQKRRAPGVRDRISAILDGAAAVGGGPASTLARREERERLAAAMAGLDADDREVLLQRHFEERTIDEIADATGRSPTSVRRLIGKATARLGRLLNGGTQ